MATDTAEPTSLQTGTTPNPFPSNTQDFSGSDDEILDNFADGPDDEIPMGLGGEKGKQSEPASSTLESDIVSGVTKQAGEKRLPSDDSASGTAPVQKPAGEKGAETSPEPTTEEPETTEFSPMLLQMAGFSDAAAALEAGFKDSESLFAAIQWRGQLLTPGAQLAQSPEQGLYRASVQQPTPPALPSRETAVEPKGDSAFKPFEIPEENREMLDENLLIVLDQMKEHVDQMNEYYRQELKTLRSSVGQREADLARQQEQEEEAQFDAAVQALGEDWQDVFGEGGINELYQAGQRNPFAMSQVDHRVRLFGAVKAIRKASAEQGFEPMPLQTEVLWALQQRYRDKFKQVISGNSTGAPAQKRGVTASRPTQRTMPPKSHDAKVLANVNAMLRKKGLASLSRDPEEEFDGEI